MSHEFSESSAKLRRIAALIREKLDDEGRFQVSSEEIVASMEVSATDFYRVLYEHRRTVHFGDAISGFSEETMGDLVTLLERFYGPEVDSFLQSEGLFLTHELRADLQERFLRAYSVALASHEVDRDVFRAMLRASRSYRSALSIYVDEYFPAETLVRETVDGFARDAPLPFPGAELASRFLRLLLSRHVVEPYELLQPLTRLLHAIAREAGYIGAARSEGARERGDNGDRAVPPSASDEVREAMRMLGLEREELTRERVRERYKSLILKFHPDVNPSGLEMSKKLNNSYSLLMAAIVSA